MIEGLKEYPEYKESGLPWLDTIPKHWDMIPNRALMREQREVVGQTAADYVLLSLTLRGIIARDMENPKGKFPAQFNTYKVVRPGNFVFCLFDIDETPRGVGLSPLKGMITGAYDVFSPTQRINPRFLYYYYLFVDDRKLMKPLYTGLRKTIQRGVFASLKAPCPLLDEQNAIGTILDHANRKIDVFIRTKRKLIGLLYEQKQAIIHRAVTRGLNSDVPLKPSGIPWLGEIPAHWVNIELRQVASGFTNGTAVEQMSKGESRFSVSRIETISSGEIDFSKVGCLKVVSESSRFWLKQNDILLSHINSFEVVGNCAIYDCDRPLIHGMNLLRITPKPIVLPRYLLAFLKSAVFRDQIAENCQASYQPSFCYDYCLKISPVLEATPGRTG